LWGKVANWIHIGFADQDKIKAFREEQNIPKEVELARSYNTVARARNPASGTLGRSQTSSSNARAQPDDQDLRPKGSYVNPLFSGNEIIN